VRLPGGVGGATPPMGYHLLLLFIYMTKFIMWIIIIGAALSLFLTACKKSPSSERGGPLVELVYESIKVKLDENFILYDCGKLSHNKYLLPTREWVVKKLVPAWFEYRKKNNLMYDVDSTNCEAFAFRCHFVSQEIEKYNVTVGVFFYTPDLNVPKGGPGHAVNVILIHENEQVTAVYFEPQTSQFINLSRSEIASCNFWYF
jgi:hypothetical protein